MQLSHRKRGETGYTGLTFSEEIMSLHQALLEQGVRAEAALILLNKYKKRFFQVAEFELPSADSPELGVKVFNTVKDPAERERITKDALLSVAHFCKGADLADAGNGWKLRFALLDDFEAGVKAIHQACHANPSLRLTQQGGARIGSP